MNVHDFRLHFHEHAGELTIHSDGGPLVGQATHTLGNTEFGNLMGLCPVLSEPADDSLRTGAQVGEGLFHAVFSDAVGRSYRQALERVRAEHSLIRVVMEYDLGQERLHEIPWELLFDPDEDRFLALADDSTLVRYLRGSGRSWERPERRVNVLLSSACPSDQPPLQLDSELKQVRAHLEPLEESGHTRLDELRHVGAERIAREFAGAWQGGNACAYHVWHHCGHGGLDRDGAFRLALHEVDGQRASGSRFVGWSELAPVVAQHRDLQLVVLNVCLGAGQRGLAAWLAALDVPAVIGFRSRVPDCTALHCADALWRRLCCLPVDEAVHGARRTLAGSHHALDFARLVVFLRCLPRPILFATAEAPAPIGE